MNNNHCEWGGPKEHLYPRNKTQCLRSLETFPVILYRYFKWTVSRDLDFWFFSWISFPQAPEYTTRAVSNFFANSRRYSQLKVRHWCRWHRWQMHKIFNHKGFNLVWTPLGSRVTYRYIFGFKFTLRFQQPDIVPKMPLKFSAGVADTRGKFFFGRRCRWYRLWRSRKLFRYLELCSTCWRKV